MIPFVFFRKEKKKKKEKKTKNLFICPDFFLLCREKACKMFVFENGYCFLPDVKYNANLESEKGKGKKKKHFDKLKDLILS